ncbi:MAG: hypothetical protein MJZ99_08960 [Bacteroidales bacterium]|nr:hypothetical protein [Bacteroidales bacterium]
MADFDQSIALDPYNASAFLNRGAALIDKADMLHSSNRTSAAAKCYRLALQGYADVLKIIPESDPRRSHIESEIQHCTSMIN